MDLRWNRFISDLAVAFPGSAETIHLQQKSIYKSLDGLYNPRRRHYHSFQHIAHCIDLLRQIPDTGLELEGALWFHDAIYDPTAGDNERQSADLAVSSLGRFKVPEEFLKSVDSLIMATAHLNTDFSIDNIKQGLIHDIDLSILGSSRRRFLEYERGIRLEYGHMDESTYRLRRTAVLRSFLSRDTIYVTDRLKAIFEKKARRNLAWLVGKLNRV